MIMATPNDVILMSSEPPKKPENWTKYVHQLVESMQLCLARLYDGLEEEGVSETSNQEVLSEDLSPADVSQMFSSHCRKLGVAFSTKTNGLVKLPMKSVISVLVRSLKVSSIQLKSRPSFFELAGLLPSIHQSALLTLAQLILCCGSNVLPQSYSLIDHTLQVLAGSKHADLEHRSITRASAFQVLCLLVEKFGWGRYIQSSTKILILELMSDIHIQEAPKKDTKQDGNVNANQSKQETELIAQRKGKKRKKGKKHKGDSYSDLPVTASLSCQENTELFNVHCTQSALQLSYLMIGAAEFSQIENLVRTVLETCRSLQRDSPPVSSPYRAVDCRLALYRAVSACATVRLGPHCNRKVTISHFQTLNLSLSLLISASHGEVSAEVQAHCRDAIILLRNTRNVNPPVVRKILPNEVHTSRDITEVEREAERLSEENKGLWQQLLDAQLELETQRREIQDLKLAANSNTVVSDVKKHSIFEYSNKSVAENPQPTESGEEEAIKDDGDEGAGGNLIEKQSESLGEDFSEKELTGQSLGNVEHDADHVQTFPDSEADVIKGPSSKSKKRKKKSLYEDFIETLSKKSKADDIEVKTASSSSARIETNHKKAETVASTSSPVTESHQINVSEDVDAMIADFVDADPDVS